VVMFLGLGVGDRTVEAFGADGEDSVLLLPFELGGRIGIVGVEIARTAAFDGFDIFRQGKTGRTGHNHMHMIGNAADRVERSA